MAAIKTVRIVRAIVVDKCGEVGHYAPLTKIQGVSARLRLGRRREILNMRKSLWITLAVLLLAIGPPAARADTVTLDVSGSLSPNGSASCSVSGCTLGGDIVINNTTGAIISEDVTVSGESPSVGPFTRNFGIGTLGGLTHLTIGDSGDNILNLVFSTPTEGSLIGYTGGPISPLTAMSCGEGCVLRLTSGALTQPVTPAPEPSSVALMLLGVGLVFVMRKRIGQRLPQAI